MKVAICGAGIFGCTAAIHAAREGHTVHLFERNAGILQEASGINQFRLHEGYHYPRSPETVQECQNGLKSFREEYGNSIISNEDHYYAIAETQSKTSGEKYIEFLDAHDLPYSTGLDVLDNVELSIRAEEGRIHPTKLLTDVSRRLSDVYLHFNTPADASLRNRFDKIIIATYASTNDVALALDCAVEPFQYEVIEKPVLQMKGGFPSVVIMDGPFCSLDPLGTTGLHVMGHVTHAIHYTNTGLEPEVPDEMAEYLNRDIITNPTITNFDKFIESGKKYIPAIADAEHVGSMYTVRTVLPNRDDTDERPTLVQELDEKVIRIFGGKIGHAVSAAQSVATILRKTGDLSQSAA